MNWKRGFKRIILVLSIIVAVFSGIFIGNIPYAKYHTTQHQPWIFDPIVVREPNEQEMKQFKNWAKEMAAKGHIIDSNYYVLDTESSVETKFSGHLNSLLEVRPFMLQRAKAQFWRDLSKPELVGICGLAGIIGAMVGFLAVWFMIWFGGLVIYRLVRWVVLGFINDTKN
jgi:hypothetical protein